jgi:hypothetical protein
MRKSPGGFALFVILLGCFVVVRLGALEAHPYVVTSCGVGVARERARYFPASISLSRVGVSRNMVLAPVGTVWLSKRKTTMGADLLNAFRVSPHEVWDVQKFGVWEVRTPAGERAIEIRGKSGFEEIRVGWEEPVQALLERAVDFLCGPQSARQTAATTP